MADVTHTVADKIDASRKELLDLTFRNPLLHYRALKSRGVEVIDADPQLIFESLVTDNKSLSFRPKSTADSVEARLSPLPAKAS